jgi:hypothetical protein
MMNQQLEDEICYNNRFSPKAGGAGMAKKKKDEWVSSGMINRQGSKKGIGVHMQQNPVMAQFITSKAAEYEYSIPVAGGKNDSMINTSASNIIAGGATIAQNQGG